MEIKVSLGVLHITLLIAQAAVPSTDIYIADLRVERGRVRVGTPVNVTARAGYDNQPCFLADGRAFLYTSIRDDGQADVYRYDLRASTSARVTATPESEYSPTPLPRGKGFSAVRVEADSTQRLWAFNAEGARPRLVLQAIKPVGYHAWGDEYTVGVFVLGTPPTLQLVDARTGEARVVARDIGRSILRVPRRTAISYVQRDSAGGRGPWVKKVDVRTRVVTPLVRALDGGEFLAWTPGGILLTASGSKLYQWDPRRGPEWEEIADFAAAGLTSVSRLAVSPRGDRLAIVAVPK
ncbi:MAG TPA: hypothetical protein VGQ06_06380 [Gemmatimonadales bacterium]|jgi:hypothetical protein|nr:hypothetical protein [Gemmatimonadales bacterium]